MTRALRERLAEKCVGHRDGFRWRGGEISRIEGFSDAVFAFAVTLMVVSLEVPRTFHELKETMQGFLAFAVWLNQTAVFLVGTGFDLLAYPAWFLREIIPSAIWTALLCPLVIVMWEHLTGREVLFDAERVVVRR